MRLVLGEVVNGDLEKFDEPVTYTEYTPDENSYLVVRYKDNQYFKSHQHFYNYCESITNNYKRTLGRDNMLAVHNLWDCYDFENHTINDEYADFPPEIISKKLRVVSSVDELKEHFNEIKRISDEIKSGKVPIIFRGSESIYEPEYYKRSVIPKGDFGLPNNVFDKLDGEAGVYFIYDKDKNLIYIGKSKSLARRLTGSINERGGRYIKYIICENHAEACIYEIHYITKLSPELNTQYAKDDPINFELPNKQKSNFVELINYE